MSILDIPPHSRHASRLALGALALIATGGFASGFLRQLDLAAPAPPPASDATGSAIAEARPIAANPLQVAQAPKPRSAPIANDAGAEDPTESAELTAQAAQPAPAVDAAVTAPEAPPPPKAAPPQAPEDPPT